MALDLSTQVPRSPFDEVDGFAWLPRLIDKARASFAGTNGEYSAYPCPADKFFLKHFGVDPTPLGEVIKGGASDEEVAKWVAANAKDGSTANRAQWRQNLLQPNGLFAKFVAWFVLRGCKEAILKRDPNYPLKTLVTSSRVLAAEEGHPAP